MKNFGVAEVSHERDRIADGDATGGHDRRVGSEGLCGFTDDRPEHAGILAQVSLRKRDHDAASRRHADVELALTVAPGSAGTDLGLECWGASRKADVLGKLLQRDVVVTPAGT
jgi:hypothetical protein